MTVLDTRTQAETGQEMVRLTRTGRPRLAWPKEGSPSRLPLGRDRHLQPAARSCISGCSRGQDSSTCVSCMIACVSA